MDLKLERTAARVQAKQIAEEMGVSRSRIGHIEASAYVTPETAARYRAALDTCTLRRTSAAA
jgi:transcriptional regulator with XRE-family HTH domain